MRVINHIFLAAAAAALALVSCTKETTDNTENTQGQKSGVRTVTVAFANPDTRTSPTDVSAGIQPVWAKNDQLTISNGSTTKTIDVPADAVGKTTFTFTTELTGTIEVYYPGGDKYATYWDNGNVKISSTQTGEFAEANLCKGTVAEDGTNLTLINQTALFQVTPPSGVKQFTITSLKSVVGGVARTGTAQPINTDGADAAAKLVITVGNNTADLGTYYVALASGVNLSDLSFEYKTDDTHGAMKGIPMKDIAAGKDAVTAGNVYTITANNWHEYVKVDGKKWATMNIGATAETGEASCGTYFAWGDVVGQTPSSFTFSHGFSWTNCPYSDGLFDESTHKNSFTKYVNSDYLEYWGGSGNVDDKTVLDLEDDAANVQWGGSWRMPTQEEFAGLAALDPEYTNNGCRLTDANENSIFLPAAGTGSGSDLNCMGIFGCYWSSSLNTDDPSLAFDLYFYVGDIYADDYSNRLVGCSVRPLSE